MRYLCSPYLCLIGLLWVLPTSAHAAVIISEIAWMGSSASANDEWIELHNTGNTSANLDGWRLSDGNNITVLLSGNIAAGAYAVLERTDDSSAPGTAFAIYTGALSNAGGTLSLYRSDGTLEDQVAGGENWENIGGDNENKNTPQYTGSGWYTAPPTPGSAPSATASVEIDSQGDTDKKISSATKEENVVIELQIPNTELSLSIDAPSTVYVNQPVPMRAQASGIGETLIRSLEHTWNFGDLMTGSGSEVEHAYDYPGTYVVTLQSTYARHDQVARKSITVLPVQFALSRTQDGDVLIHNNAKYETDVSGYTIAGEGSFQLPPLSVIVPRGTIRVPKKFIGANTGGVTLKDQAGTSVAHLQSVFALITPSSSRTPVVYAAAKPDSVESVAAIPSSKDVVVKDTEVASDSNFSFNSDVVFEETVEASQAETQPSEALAHEAVAAIEPLEDTSTRNMLPFVGLLGVVAVGLFAVLFTKSH